VIQREVQDPLALALLRGEFAEGDAVQVEARDGGIVFEKSVVVWGGLRGG
jgi:ATP-dependent Clp protease ATP-binding subunit ClpA